GIIDIRHDARGDLFPLLDEHVACNDVAGRGVDTGQSGEAPCAAGVALVSLGQTTFSAGLAGGGGLIEELLQRQPVCRQIKEQVLGEDYLAPANDHDPAGIDIGCVVEGQALDLTGDLRSGRDRKSKCSSSEKR